MTHSHAHAHTRTLTNPHAEAPSVAVTKGKSLNCLAFDSCCGTSKTAAEIGEKNNCEVLVHKKCCTTNAARIFCLLNSISTAFGGRHKSSFRHRISCKALRRGRALRHGRPTTVDRTRLQPRQSLLPRHELLTCPKPRVPRSIFFFRPSSERPCRTCA